MNARIQAEPGTGPGTGPGTAPEAPGTDFKSVPTKCQSLQELVTPGTDFKSVPTKRQPLHRGQVSKLSSVANHRGQILNLSPFIRVMASGVRVQIQSLAGLAGLLLGIFTLTPIFIPGQTAIADGTTADAYTLSQAFLDTLVRDARVQAAENRVAEARERLVEVNSSRRPSLTISGNTGYAHNQSEARVRQTYEGHSYRGRVQLNQNLYTFGRLEGRQRRAEAEIAEAEYAFEEVRQEILAEVARAFSEQLFRERIYESRRAFELLLGDLEGIARSRIELGTLDRTELFEVLRRQHQGRAQRIEANSRYRVARAQLARLTGSIHDNLAPTSLAGLELATPANLEYALNQAESQSPALLRAHMRLEAAEGELDYRKAELWPTLSLEVNASAGHVGPIDTRDIVGGVNLSVPMYEGGLKRSQLRGARLAVETARRELSAEREQVDINVRSNWDLLQGLIHSLREFEGAVTDMEEVIELTGSKLDVGRATFVQHIEARQSALDVEFDMLDSRLRLEETRIALLRILAELTP